MASSQDYGEVMVDRDAHLVLRLLRRKIMINGAFYLTSLLQELPSATDARQSAELILGRVGVQWFPRG